MPRVIGILSGKGGVGKTTLTANLGIAFSQFGRSVTLVDCNVTTSHLGFCFGLYHYPVTLNQVLKGEASLEEATYFYHGVKIVPASLRLEDLIGLDIEELKDTLNFEDTEIAILDSSPGLGREALATLKACDEIIFVTIPYMNAISDVIRCSKLLKELDVKPLGIVLNMVRDEAHELKENEVESLTGLEVIAKIPFDKNVQRSLAKGIPTLIYKPYSKASIATLKLAANLLNEHYVEPKVGIFSRLFDSIREIFSAKKQIETPF